MNVTLKHRDEIKARLDQMGVFDTTTLVDLIERWRFSEFVGKLSLGIAYHVFISGFTEGDLNNEGDYNYNTENIDINKIARNADRYIQNVGEMLHRRIISYHKEGNYSQTVTISPLLLWFSSIDFNQLVKLGEYLLDIYATPYFDAKDRETIVLSALSDTDDTLRNLRGAVERASDLVDIFKDEIEKGDNNNTVELFNAMKGLFENDGNISKVCAEDIFTRRHSAVVKSVLDVGDDISLGTYISMKTEVLPTLSIFWGFLEDLYGNDSAVWNKNENILREYNGKLGDLLERAVDSSSNLRIAIMNIMAEDVAFATEFSFSEWVKIIEKARAKSTASIFEKLLSIQALVCLGSVGGEFADESSSLMQDCFIAAIPVNEQEAASKSSIVSVIKGLNQISNIKKRAKD